jgi:hypothetical protein
MDTKERKTPLSGALFSPPDPKLAPGTAASGKKRLRRTVINFKGIPQKFFGAIFHRLILRCSLRSETIQPGFSLADQAHQPALFFGQEAEIVEQFFAVQNDPRSRSGNCELSRPLAGPTTQMGKMILLGFALPT